MVGLGGGAPKLLLWPLGLGIGIGAVADLRGAIGSRGALRNSTGGFSEDDLSNEALRTGKDGDEGLLEVSNGPGAIASMRFMRGVATGLTERLSDPGPCFFSPNPPYAPGRSMGRGEGIRSSSNAGDEMKKSSSRGGDKLRTSPVKLFGVNCP